MDEYLHMDSDRQLYTDSLRALIVAWLNASEGSRGDVGLCTQPGSNVLTAMRVIIAGCGLLFKSMYSSSIKPRD